MKVIKIEDEYNMILKMIDLALLLKLPSKYSLLPREKEFLANTILLSNKKIALESGDMVNAICDKMLIKKADVYNYRKTLKRKGWLMQTVTGFELLPFLDYSKKKIPSSLKINYNLVIE
jgi:hypothetical protein